jgi:hypothetical protein
MRFNASTRAREPPPAPISIISMTGIRTGSPLPFRKRAERSTSKLRDFRGSNSSIRQILAVVPPMSKDRTRFSPRSAAILAARIAPPAGPDSTRRIGNRLAVSRLASDPPEVIRWIGAVEPSRAKASCCQS